MLTARDTIPSPHLDLIVELVEIFDIVILFAFPE